MERIENRKITPEDITRWATTSNLVTSRSYALEWFADILNGDYELDEARSDILYVLESLKEKEDGN